MKILNKKALTEIKQSNFEDGLEQEFIAVVQFNDGKFGVVQAKNAAFAISCMNTPKFNDFYPDGYAVNKIHGVKEVTEERTLDSVTKKFQDIAGKANVYSMAVA